MTKKQYDANKIVAGRDAHSATIIVEYNGIGDPSLNSWRGC